MKFIKVKLTEISQHPTMRLDARYWIQKQLLKKRRLKSDRHSKIQKRKFATQDIR